MLRIISIIGAFAAVVVAAIWTIWQTPVPSPQTALPPSATQGNELFARYCASCHAITAPDGTVFAGQGSMAGPNLYQVLGRPAGQDAGFRYSSALLTAGADHGLIWTAEAMAEYVQDPSGFLREVTGDDRARSKMSFRLRTHTANTDAQSITLYLGSMSGD